MSRFFESGFVDSFRSLHPDVVAYTWWRTTQFARKINQGWRLDYQVVSDTIGDCLVHAEHLTDAMHSDHCPVLIEIDLVEIEEN